MFRYEIGSRLFFKNIIGNIIMFMPYGFMVGYYLKLEKPDFVVILTLIVSSCIETIQLVIGRVFDIDDIILNLMGGIIGAYIYTVLYKIESILPSFLKKDWFYNIIILIVSLIFILYLLDFINLGV
jgi:glycopeptide antibiotics resistance protein